ncbi:hypothetical protein ACQY1Q_07240 [Tenacibaculum sp. TC6]|uniref:hypothetical protein n=1 Tax=Tenacibaculum sp. TC6 TaxID=3423223 RepID=UPI003D36213A
MKQNKETLKQFFETGDKPTQQQYTDLIDSYIDSKQEAGEANRRFVIDETGEVSVASEQSIPEYTLSPIFGTNTVDLLKDGVSVSQIDLTPYLDNTNLARLVSGTVDGNGLATFTRDDNSTFTVDFSGFLGGNNTLNSGEGTFISTLSSINGISYTGTMEGNYNYIGNRVDFTIKLDNISGGFNDSDQDVKINIPIGVSQPINGLYVGDVEKSKIIIEEFSGWNTNFYSANAYMTSVGALVIFIRLKTSLNDVFYDKNLKGIPVTNAKMTLKGSFYLA